MGDLKANKLRRSRDTPSNGDGSSDVRNYLHKVMKVNIDLSLTLTTEVANDLLERKSNIPDGRYHCMLLFAMQSFAMDAK